MLVLGVDEISRGVLGIAQNDNKGMNYVKTLFRRIPIEHTKSQMDPNLFLYVFVAGIFLALGGTVLYLKLQRRYRSRGLRFGGSHIELGRVTVTAGRVASAAALPVIIVTAPSDDGVGEDIQIS